MYFWNQSLSDSKVGLEDLLIPLQTYKIDLLGKILMIILIVFIITSAEEVIFLLALVCLSVCLSICAQNQKVTNSFNEIFRAC